MKAVTVDNSLGKCTGWAVALAETFPAAMKAAKALKVEVDPGPYGKLGLDDIFAEFCAEHAEPECRRELGARRATSTRPWRTPNRSWSRSTPPTWCATPPWSRSTAMVQHSADDAWHVHIGTQSTSFARMTLTGYLVDGAQARSPRTSRCTCTSTWSAVASAASRTTTRSWPRHTARRSLDGR